MTAFETKDSGQHEQFDSGMRRDTQEGKPRFALMWTKLQPYEQQMVTRYAALLARGAAKYDDRNWENGDSEVELERAKDSLLRHAAQLVAGETDEDHAAAVWFNTQAIEYFRWRIAEKEKAGALTLHFDGSLSGDQMLVAETLYGGRIVIRGDLKSDEAFLIPGDVTKATKIEVTPEPEPRTLADYLPPPVDHADSPCTSSLPCSEACEDEGAIARAKHRRNLQEWHNRPVTEPASQKVRILPGPSVTPAEPVKKRVIDWQTELDIDPGDYDGFKDVDTYALITKQDFIARCYSGPDPLDDNRWGANPLDPGC